MEHEEKVQELAKTLKSSGLAASVEDALERAREILKPKKVEETAVQETLVEEKDRADYDITKEEKTVTELLAEDADKIYEQKKEKESSEEKIEEKKEEKVVETPESFEPEQDKGFMVKTEAELEEEKEDLRKEEKKVDLTEIFNFGKKE